MNTRISITRQLSLKTITEMNEWLAQLIESNGRNRYYITGGSGGFGNNKVVIFESEEDAVAFKIRFGV